MANQWHATQYFRHTTGHKLHYEVLYYGQTQVNGFVSLFQTFPTGTQSLCAKSDLLKII